MTMTQIDLRRVLNHYRDNTHDAYLEAAGFERHELGEDYVEFTDDSAEVTIAPYGEYGSGAHLWVAISLGSGGGIGFHTPVVGGLQVEPAGSQPTVGMALKTEIDEYRAVEIESGEFVRPDLATLGDLLSALRMERDRRRQRWLFGLLQRFGAQLLSDPGSTIGQYVDARPVTGGVA